MADETLNIIIYLLMAFFLIMIFFGIIKIMWPWLSGFANNLNLGSLLK